MDRTRLGDSSQAQVLPPQYGFIVRERPGTRWNTRGNTRLAYAVLAYSRPFPVRETAMRAQNRCSPFCGPS
jgi:hypothetical protein